jgi:hypothetical protein
MRTNANASWCVVLPDLREQKQHEQGSSFGGYVDMPVKVVAWIGVGWETGIHVPTRVARIVRGGKPNGKCPEIRTRQPSPWTDKLIEGSVQDRRIRGSYKWLLSVNTEPDDRLGPGCWIRLIAARVPPENCTALVCKIAREGRQDPHKSIADELLDLGVAQVATTW